MEYRMENRKKNRFDGLIPPGSKGDVHGKKVQKIRRRLEDRGINSVPSIILSSMLINDVPDDSVIFQVEERLRRRQIMPTDPPPAPTHDTKVQPTYFTPPPPWAYYNYGAFPMLPTAPGQGAVAHANAMVPPGIEATPMAPPVVPVAVAPAPPAQPEKVVPVAVAPAPPAQPEKVVPVAVAPAPPAQPEKVVPVAVAPAPPAQPEKALAATSTATDPAMQKAFFQFMEMYKNKEVMEANENAVETKALETKAPAAKKKRSGRKR